MVVLFSFLIFKIYPFGDSTIVAIDSNTQYVSFVSNLKWIFLGLNDFKYTFCASSLLLYFLEKMQRYLHNSEKSRKFAVRNGSSSKRLEK